MSKDPRVQTCGQWISASVAFQRRKGKTTDEAHQIQHHIGHCMGSDVSPRGMQVFDFKMVTLMSRKDSRVMTTMRVTLKYLAPEWLFECAITEKSDVYNFGMWLFNEEREKTTDEAHQIQHHIGHCMGSGVSPRGIQVFDFGMATLMSRKDNRVMITMRGTSKYLAPEWLFECVITEKSDVYNFGMVFFSCFCKSHQKKAAIWVALTVFAAA
ncbi:hypothetical protein KI387_006208, partial [Taxus chinensis]